MRISGGEAENRLARFRSENAGSRPKLVNHDDETGQEPAVGSTSDVDTKRLLWCARLECAREQRAEFERSADDLAAGTQNRRVNVEAIKLRASVDKVVLTCRANRHISGISCHHRRVIGLR